MPDAGGDRRPAASPAGTSASGSSPHASAPTEPKSMAKRRAEDTALQDPAPKRRLRQLCGVDARLESVPPAGGVSLSPPPLLALWGRRCRKRPHSLQGPDPTQDDKDPAAAAAAAAGIYRKATHGDTGQHAAAVLTLQTSGSFQARRDPSAPASHKKRAREAREAREDGAGSGTAVPQDPDKAAEGDTDAGDCAYNSFQFWRVPLPQLDLSLLEDVNSQSQTKQRSKVKDSSSDAMET